MTPAEIMEQIKKLDDEGKCQIGELLLDEDSTAATIAVGASWLANSRAINEGEPKWALARDAWRTIWNLPERK